MQIRCMHFVKVHFVLLRCMHGENKMLNAFCFEKRRSQVILNDYLGFVRFLWSLWIGVIPATFLSLRGSEWRVKSFYEGGFKSN